MSIVVVLQQFWHSSGVGSGVTAVVLQWCWTVGIGVTEVLVQQWCW